MLLMTILLFLSCFILLVKVSKEVLVLASYCRERLLQRLSIVLAMLETSSRIRGGVSPWIDIVSSPDDTDLQPLFACYCFLFFSLEWSTEWLDEAEERPKESFHPPASNVSLFTVPKEWEVMQSSRKPHVWASASLLPVL